MHQIIVEIRGLILLNQTTKTFLHNTIETRWLARFPCDWQYDHPNNCPVPSFSTASTAHIFLRQNVPFIKKYLVSGACRMHYCCVILC